MEHILDHDADIAFVTETWLTSLNNTITSEIKDYNYLIKHNVRDNPYKDGGGGVGILFKNTLIPTQIKSGNYNSFEHTIVKLPCAKYGKVRLKKIDYLFSVT